MREQVNTYSKNSTEKPCGLGERGTRETLEMEFIITIVYAPSSIAFYHPTYCSYMHKDKMNKMTRPDLVCHHLSLSEDDPKLNIHGIMFYISWN